MSQESAQFYCEALRKRDFPSLPQANHGKEEHFMRGSWENFETSVTLFIATINSTAVAA